MVDPERVRRLLVLLRQTSALLAEESDAIRRRHRIQTAAQICIDLAAHVIASEGFRPPATYADTFTVLAEEGIIDAPLARALRDLAGLRNLIVHLYAQVDDDRVAAEVAGGLPHLDAFAQVMGLLATG